MNLKRGKERILSPLPSFILFKNLFFPCNQFLRVHVFPRGDSQVKAYLAGAASSSANVSRSLDSSSLDRLVAIISNLNPLMASATLSSTASLVNRKRAEVPSVTLPRTDFMKSSLIPTWAMEPASAPIAAPTTIPNIGIKNIRPNNKPQKAPLSAPAPVKSLKCFVFGFFFPIGQVTIAASCRLISCFLLKPSITSSASSAPLAVSNFRTVRVAIIRTPFYVTDFVGYCVFMPSR